MATSDDIKTAVRDRYAAAARVVLAAKPTSCCGGGSQATESAEALEENAEGIFGSSLYGSLDSEEVPDAAVLASLGCGNPTAVAELHAGETVLDLGSGGGIDVFLSAKRVGPTGFVYGLDMTEEMLELARRNQAEAGVTNVEFLRGEIEAVPLPDNSVDVVLSNCVINLSTDKPAVFGEAHRVLKPGGRFAVSDVLTTRTFTDAERENLASWTGCIAGALSRDEYTAGLEAAGFKDVEVIVSHEIGGDVISAIVRATA